MSNARVTPQMWVRRIVSSILLIAVVAALILGGVKGYGALHKRLSAHQEKVSSTNVNLPVSIAQCRGANLEVTTQFDPSVAPVGSGTKVDVTVTNRGSEECSLETADVQVSLLSGEQVIWSPTLCSETWDRQLLLGAAKSWQGTLSWNGGLYDECQSLTGGDEETQLIADEGTYQLRVALLGEKTAPDRQLLVTY